VDPLWTPRTCSETRVPEQAADAAETATALSERTASLTERLDQFETRDAAAIGEGDADNEGDATPATATATETQPADPAAADAEVSADD
jgi:hypothetical protein